MFMKEGAIVDSGTHDQLMAGDNEYATLIKMFYTQEKEEENKPGTVQARWIFFLHSPPRTSYQCPRGTFEYFHRGRHSGNTVDLVYTQHRVLANQIHRNPTAIVLIP